MSTVQAMVQDLLDELADHIDESRQLLEAGETVDLDMLPPMVEKLFKAVRGLDRAEYQATSEQITAMMTGLALLEESLRMRKSEVAEELQALALLRRATKAYQGGNG